MPARPAGKPSGCASPRTGTSCRGPCCAPGLGAQGGPRRPMSSSHQHCRLRPGLPLGGSQACVSGDPVPQETQKGKDGFLGFTKGRLWFWGRGHSAPRRTNSPLVPICRQSPALRQGGLGTARAGCLTLCHPLSLSHPTVRPHASLVCLLVSVHSSLSSDQACWDACGWP